MNVSSRERLSRPGWPYWALSGGVLLLGLLYTFVPTYLAPYPGLTLDRNWVVTAIDDCSTDPAWCLTNTDLIQRGDRVLEIDGLNHKRYSEDRTTVPFEGRSSGDYVSMQVQRGDQVRAVRWTMPVVRYRDWQTLLAGLVIFLPFWIAGTLILLLLQPHDLRWRLLVLFNYVTVLWLVTGLYSTRRLLYSLPLEHAFTWLLVPILLQLHLTLPSPLAPRVQRWLFPILYILAGMLAALELLQFLPPDLFLLGILLFLPATVGVLLLRLVLRPPPSDRLALRLMLTGVVLGFGPGLLLTLISGAIPASSVGFVIAVATLAIAFLPFFYLYAIYKRTLGGLEFRANRVLSLYSFSMLFATAFTVAFLLTSSWFSLSGEALFFSFILSFAFAILLAPLRSRYQEFFDRVVYGARFNPEEIVRAFANRIPQALEEGSLGTLLRVELAPSLLIRQSALYIVENGSCRLLFAEGIGLPERRPCAQLEPLAAEAERYRPPETTPAGEFAWVRLIFPLRSRGELLGLWLLGRRDPDDFYPQGDVALLKTLGNQIAAALANIRLFEETRTRAQQFELLYDAGLTLNSVQQPRAQLEYLFQIATRTLRAERMAFYRYDPALGMLRYELGVGYSTFEEEGLLAQDLPLRSDPGAVGWVARTRRPLYLPDVRADARFTQVEGRTRAAVWVPVQHQNRLLGVLSVASDRLEAFQPNDERMLSLFANQAAVALENTRLFQQVQTSLAHTTRLYELSGQVMAAATVPELSQLVAGDLRTAFEADIVGIHLYDEHGVLEYQHAAGIPETILGRIRPRPDGLLARARQSSGPVLENNPEVMNPVMRAEGIRSAAALPLRGKSGSLGAMVLHYRQARVLGTEEVQLLSLFANQTALAVERIRSFEAIQERVHELEAVNRISRLLREARTVREMLPMLLDEALTALHTDAGSIWFFDNELNQLRPVVARNWMDHQDAALKPGEGIAGRVFATGERVVTREFYSDVRTAGRILGQVQPGWGGACVPIRTANEGVGVLFVGVPLPRELTSTEVHFISTLAEIAGSAIHRMRLHETLEESYLQTVLALAKAMDARDDYTGGHSDRLSEMAVAMWRELQLPADGEETLRFAARLHDIGKIGVPDAILRKPGPLDAFEWVVMKKHPQIGAEILQPVRRLEKVVPIVRHHQERYDGTGYPDGLSGAAIPIEARILAVADAYGAMLDDRVYRKGFTRAEALAELKRNSGTQFDPTVVAAFLRTPFARVE